MTRTHKSRALATISSLTLGVGLALVWTPTAQAASLGPVSTEADLVTAITTANGNGEADVITLAGSGFTLSADLPTITTEISIVGPGSGSFVLNGNGFRTIYLDHASGTVSLSGFKIDTGGTDDSLGGIESDNSNFVLNDINVSGSYIGLAAYNSTGTVTNSIFQGSDAQGAFISYHSGAISFQNVQFKDNADEGLYADVYGDATLNVSQATATNDQGIGFAVYGATNARVTFTNTTSTLSGYYGYYVEFGGNSQCSFTDSNANNNDYNGFTLDFYDDVKCDFTNTTSTENDGDGIELDTDNRVAVTFTNTTTSRNDSDGMEADVRKHGSLTINGFKAEYNDGDGLDAEAYLGNVVTATNINVTGNGDAGVEFGAHNVGSSVTFTNVTSTGNTNGAKFDEVVHGGSATLRNATLSGNDERGILIDQEAADSTGSVITIDNVTSSGNGDGTLNGGGLTLVQSHGLQVNVSNSTISGNSALRGGGVYARLGNNDPASLSIVNSTISGNDAGTAGAVHVQSGANGLFEILNSTIANNSTTGSSTGADGRAVYLQGADTTIRNSIISGNSAGDLDANTGTPLTVDYSLIETAGAGANAAISAGTGNITGLSANLGPLANNGGPTLTHLPSSTSPAVNAGDPAFSGLTNDQRGLDRVFERLDMGAVERQPELAATGADSAVPLFGGAFIVGAGILLLAVRRKLATR